MENFPKSSTAKPASGASPKSSPKRGRPRKIPEPMEREMGLEVPEAMREMFGSLGKTDRTNANLYYANTAKEVVEFFAEQVRTSPTDDPVRSAKRRLGLDWILGRQTVLTEIGRTM